MTHPALALIEFDSIAAGIQAGDGMVKTAPVSRIVGGTVHPGKYLVMITGDVAPVQKSDGRVDYRQQRGDGSRLPDRRPSRCAAASHGAPAGFHEALGIVETSSVSSAIHAADAGLKAAQVTLLELRLADGLGGKGLLFFAGTVTDVEAALDAATGAIADSGHLLNAVVIPQLHPEMTENLLGSTQFHTRASAR